MNRDRMLHWAEAIDRYRVFPRAFLLGCFWWTIDITHELLNWYETLPKDDRAIEATAFAGVAFTGVLAFLKLVYQTYSDAGQTWGTPATQTTTSTLQTTTVQP